ncbi:MAG: hypothetical protein ACOZNI_01660 [Myxococcota bacterium]
MLVLLVACAPVAMMPPPTPFAEGQHFEVGGALTGSAYDTRFSTCGTDFGAPCSGLGLHGYALGRIGPVDLGGLVYAGMAEAAGGGVLVRVSPVDTRRFRLGAQLDGGWIWAALGVPVAVGLSDRVWLYSQPSAGWRTAGVVRVPLGVSIRMPYGYVAHFEAGVGTGHVEGRFRDTVQGVTTGWVAVGSGYRW